MKFFSEIKIENKSCITNKKDITVENIFKSINRYIPVILNGLYLPEEILKIFNSGDSLALIGSEDDEIVKNRNLLSLSDNQVVMSSIEFTNIILRDHKLSKYKIIVINNFHKRNAYYDLIIGNLAYIQNERKKVNLDPLKIMLFCAPMPIDFLVELFSNVVIYNIDNCIQGEEKCIENDLKCDNYLNGVLKSICLTLTNQMIQKGNYQTRILVFLANHKHATLINRWLCHNLPISFSQDIYVTDKFNKNGGLTNHSSLIFLTHNSDPMFINSLGIEFNCVIDSGYMSAKRFNSISKIDSMNVMRINVTESLIRANAKKTSGSCLIKLYTEELVNKHFMNNSPVNLYRTQCDITDFLLCQLSIGREAMKSFKSVFLYINVIMISGIENLLKANLVRRRLQSSDSDTIITKNKMITTLEQYELTDFGKQCLISRIIDCRSNALLLNAVKNNCALPCLTLISLLHVADSIFLDEVESVTDTMTLWREFYNGNDDFMFLLNLYRHYISLSKEERLVFIKRMNISRSAITAANNLRSSIKSSVTLTTSLKTSIEVDKLVCCLLETYPEQVVKYCESDKLYRRDDQGKGMSIDPRSFCYTTPPQYLFYYSCYSHDKNVFMRLVCPVSDQLWAEHSLNRL